MYSSTSAGASDRNGPTGSIWSASMSSRVKTARQQLQVMKVFTRPFINGNLTAFACMAANFLPERIHSLRCRFVKRLRADFSSMCVSLAAPLFFLIFASPLYVLANVQTDLSLSLHIPRLSAGLTAVIE